MRSPELYRQAGIPQPSIPLPDPSATMAEATRYSGKTIYQSDPVSTIGRAQNRSAEAGGAMKSAESQRFYFGGGPNERGYGGFGVTDETYLDNARKKAWADQEAASLGEYLKNGGAFKSGRYQNWPK